MSLSLAPGSCCLITGASDPDSIGYACAVALIQARAAHVMILGRDASRVAAAVTRLTELSPKTTPTTNTTNNDDNNNNNTTTVHALTGDLKDPESMTRLLQDAVATKLGGRLDVLVLSGGNGGSEYLGLDASNLASYRTMYDVAVLSPLMLAQAAVPTLSQSPAGGSIVMISSMAVHVPWPDTAPYNYAKAAQNNLIQTLAFQLRTSNVRVNGVLPACIHTGALNRMAQKKNVPVGDYAKLRGDAHPMGRNGTPENVAQAVLFLASPASAFTTGELIKVDGGLHLSNWFNKPRMLAEYRGEGGEAQAGK